MDLVKPALIAALMLSPVLAGCGRDAPERPLTPPPEPQAGSNAADDRWEAAKRNATEAGSQFYAAARERLDDLQARLNDLAERAKAKGAEAQAEFDRRRPEMERKIANAKEQLARMKDSSGAAWEKAKAGFSAAVDDLQKSLGEAADELRGTRTKE